MPSITVNDVDLYYELTGPQGAPVVAFSNSIGTTLEMWDAQAEALSAHYRCLRYDTRGHGRSAVADRPARIADLADSSLAARKLGWREELAKGLGGAGRALLWNLLAVPVALVLSWGGGSGQFARLCSAGVLAEKHLRLCDLRQRHC